MILEGHVLVVLVEASTKLEKEEILEQLDVSFYHEKSTGPAGAIQEDPGPLLLFERLSPTRFHALAHLERFSGNTCETMGE